MAEEEQPVDIAEPGEFSLAASQAQNDVDLIYDIIGCMKDRGRVS